MKVPNFKFCLSDNLANISANSLIQPTDFLPNQSNSFATGYDVRCAEPKGIVLKPDSYVKVPLGIRVICPDGWWLELKPRSSAFIKKHLHALYGTVDCDFSGQLYFCAQFKPDCSEIISRSSPTMIEFGERIAQLVPVEKKEMIVENISTEEFNKLVDERNSSRKNTEGLGSTGKF